MLQETVDDYVMKRINEREDFEMLHQYTVDKIRSCDFGPDYGYAYTQNHSGFGFRQSKSTHYITRDEFIKSIMNVPNDLRVHYTITSLYTVKNMPLTVYEYVYNHIDYPKFIHQCLLEHKIITTGCAYKECNQHKYNIIIVDDIQCDMLWNGWGDVKYRYMKYCFIHHKQETWGRDSNYELYDIYPYYIEPKHAKQDYINYFITNDFNCNRLRKLIIALSKIMLSRREEDITQHIKQDEIIDDLQLLINYAHRLIIECKEYIDKQNEQSTVKLTL